MSFEILCPSLPCIPICASYSRRLQSVFTASPLNSYSLNGESGPSLSYRGHADCIRLSRDERNLAVSSGTLIKLVDLVSGREIRNLPAHHTLPVKAVCPTRSSIYSWISGSLDSSWTLWDTRCHPANVLGGHVGGPIKCVDVSPNDSLLAVGTASSLHLFDIRNRQPARFFPCSAVGVQFNPVQMMLATYGLDRVVRFWCLDQMECVSQSDALSSPIKGIAFSGERDNPENDYLLAATDTELRMLTWEPCDTLFSRQLSEQYSVLELNFSEGVANLSCFSVNNSLAMITYSIEDILTREDERLSVEFTVDEGEIEEEEDLLIPTDSSTSPSPSSSSGSTCSIRNNTNNNNNNNSIHTKPRMAAATIPRSAPSNIAPRRPNAAAGVSSDSVPQKLNTQPSTPTTGRVTRASSASRYQKVNSTDSLSSRPRSPTEPPALNRPTRLSLNEKTKAASSATSTSNTSTITAKSARLPPLPTRKPSPATRTSVREVPKEITTLNSTASTPKIENNESLTAQDLLTSLLKGHYSTLRLIDARNLEAERFSKSIRSGASDVGLVGGDSVIRRRLFQQFTQQKRWDLRLVHSHIVGIKMMLGDTKSIDTAMEALDFIVRCLADKFKSFANSTAACGVDVAQEQRKEKSEFVIKELRELVKHRDTYYKELSQENVLRLDALMEYIKEI